MDGTTNKMSGLSSEETLERFVIRARRVENNSLVKSGDVGRYAIPKMTYNVTESGDASIHHHVCTDEEAVESLASRLRPFIVKSEPDISAKDIRGHLRSSAKRIAFGRRS